MAAVESRRVGEAALLSRGRRRRLKGERSDEAAQLLAGREGEGVVSARGDQVVTVGAARRWRRGAGPTGAFQDQGRRFQPALRHSPAVVMVGGETGEAEAVVEFGPLPSSSGVWDAKVGAVAAARPQRVVSGGGGEGAEVAGAARVWGVQGRVVVRGVAAVSRRVGLERGRRRRGRLLLGRWRISTAAGGRWAALVRVVDEMAARPIGAKADGVESAAQLRLVLGVAGQAAELVEAVSELALFAVLAGTALFERPAELCLVTCGVDRRSPSAVSSASSPIAAAAALSRRSRCHNHHLLLVQLLHEVLASFAVLAERPVSKLVLLVQQGDGGAAAAACPAARLLKAAEVRGCGQ